MKTQINGKSASWSPGIAAFWNEVIKERIKPGETITEVNYFSPRPYIDEYNKGSNKEGFVYTINGRHVAQFERVVSEEKPLCTMCMHGTSKFCLRCRGCKHTCTCKTGFIPANP